MHQRRQSSHFPNRKRTYPGLAIFVFAFWSARAPGISRLALKTLLPRVDIRPASAPKRKRPRLFRVTGRPVEQCSPRSLLTTPYVPMCTGGMALMGEALLNYTECSDNDVDYVLGNPTIADSPIARIAIASGLAVNGMKGTL